MGYLSLSTPLIGHTLEKQSSMAAAKNHQEARGACSPRPWKMFEPQVGEICWKLGYDVSCGFDGCKDFPDRKWADPLSWQ